MDLLESERILACLERGEHPFHGEKLINSEVCADEEIQTAIRMVRRKLHAVIWKREKEERQAQSEQLVNQGKLWRSDEDDWLLEMYDRGVEKERICHCLGRTEDGIAARLVRLGRIQDRTVFKKRK